MGFVDKLYYLYRDKLTGDEEDILAIVLDILQEHNREELITIIKDMDDEEVYQMVGGYLVDMLRLKAEKEGLGYHTPDKFNQKYH